MRLYRIAQGLLPTRIRLAWARSSIDNGYAKEVAAARRTGNHDAIHSLESERQFELGMCQEEEDCYLTRRLLRECRRLRVPIPRTRNAAGSLSEHWYEGSQTGGLHLTDSGISRLREDIRKEQRARHESRAQLTVWLSALTGILGAITGLVAISQK